MTIGEKIKQLRIAKGYSQEELGKKIGVKKAAIHKYEHNIIANLKLTTIANLAAALDCTPAYLMGWQDETTTSYISTLLSQQENKLITQYRTLSLGHQTFLNSLTSFLSSHPSNQEILQMVKQQLENNSSLS